jgi:tetratricopeptide (TPR) repeat protein
MIGGVTFQMEALQVYIFFDGPISSWAVIQVPSGVEPLCMDVVSQFLNYLVWEKQFSIPLADVTVHQSRMDWNNPEVPLDFSDRLVYRSRQIDLVVRPRARPDCEPRTVSQANFLGVARDFLSRGQYRSAHRLFSVSGPRGLREAVQMLAASRSWDALVATLRAAAAPLPGDADFLAVMGEMYEGIGRVEEAVNCYRRVCRSKENARVLARLAWLLREDGEMSDRLLLRARQTDDRVAEVTATLARQSFLAGRHEAALDYCIRNCENYAILVEFCRESEMFSRGLVAFTVSRLIDCDTVCRFVHVLYKNGAVFESLSVMGQVFRNSKYNGYVASQYFYYLLQQRQFPVLFETMLDFVNCRGKELLTGTRPAFISSILDCFLSREAVRECMNKLPEESRFSEERTEFDLAVMEYSIALVLDGRVSEFCMAAQTFSEQKLVQFQFRFAPEILTLYRICESAAFGFCDAFQYFPQVLAVGDPFCAALSRARIAVGASLFSIVCHPIFQLSLAKLDSPNSISVAFWDSIGSVSHYGGLLLVLGTYDCEVVIPKAVSKLRYQSPSHAVQHFVGVYARIVERVQRQFGQHVFLIPAFPRFRWAAPIVQAFNKRLREVVTVPVIQVVNEESPVQTIPVDRYGIPKSEFLLDIQRAFDSISRRDQIESRPQVQGVPPRGEHLSTG